MARTKRDRYEKERERISRETEKGSISTGDAEAIGEFLDAKNPEIAAVVDQTEDYGKAISTLASYANTLRRLAENVDYNLIDAKPNQLNQTFDAMRSGDVQWVKDGGLTAGSVANFQTTVRKFYEYHDELGIEKSEISLFTGDGSSVDERDVFDKSDIEAIRDAAGHPRDKALVDLLLYTGQRVSAIANLRLRDIDLQEGVFYLNEEAGELKGATGKRPLLYAQKSVREWYNQHPCKGDPDAHFITHRHDWQTDRIDVGDRLDHSSIHRVLKTVGKRADVDKPMNAHNFRHTFVTVCKRDYGMDNDTIKRLLGHGEGSTIMETTYSHLSDDDVIAEAERSMDLREDEPESPLTPDICGICGEPVGRDNAKACAACGQVFTPDAHAAHEKIDQLLWKSKGDASEDQESSVDNLKEAIENNPAAKAELIELLDLEAA